MSQKSKSAVSTTSRKQEKYPVHAPDYMKAAVSVDCVIFGFEENQLKVLLIRSDLEIFKNLWSLLGDLVHPEEDVDSAVSRVVKSRTGLTNVYLEQIHTFGRTNRHPEGRVITIVYCSLINIKNSAVKKLDNELHWHDVSTLDKMAFDHKEILAQCYKWLQRRMHEHPLGLNLLEPEFSLRDLQLLYERIFNEKLDRRNFRKKFFNMGLLIDTGKLESAVPHRPGKLYRFDYDKYNSMSQKKWLGVNF